jgi:EpsI family protein
MPNLLARLLAQRVATRLFIAAAIVVAMAASAQLVRARRSQIEVEMPKWRADQVPLELGSWHGEPTTLDTNIFRHVGAAAIRDVLYHSATEPDVVLHLAVFDDEFTSLPHHPNLCYTGNGYRQASSRTIQLRRGDEKTMPAALLIFERPTDRVAVLYWYQFGDRVLTESSQTAAIRWSLGGRRSRPALVKIMLQTNFDSPERAEQRLRDVARLVLQWTASTEQGAGSGEQGAGSTERRGARRAA